jgi:proline dehydrogenase
MIGKPALVKIGTSLTNFALQFHLPVEGIIRKTVFDHFCGGVSEQDCLQVVAKMHTKGVSSVLDYSVEGKEEEAQFDACLKMTLKTIDFAKGNKAIPFAVFKPTGLGRIDLYEKVGLKASLSANEQEEWNRVVARFEKICQYAFDNDVQIKLTLLLHNTSFPLFDLAAQQNPKTHLSQTNLGKQYWLIFHANRDQIHETKW